MIMTKISVIVPIYKAEKYIVKCLKSLEEQTLDDMEVLLVDDHGNDKTMDIVRNFVNNSVKSSIFTILTPEHNIGAGQARNFAIESANGEYLAFVDSDDWIEPDMYEKLYSKAREFDADVCYGNAIKEFEEEGQKSSILKNPEIASGEVTCESRRHFLTNFASMFWTFIYRKDFLNKYSIRFPKVKWAEDSYFVSATMFMAQKAACVSTPFYHYLIRSNSMSTTTNPYKHRDRIEAFKKMIDFAKANGVYDRYKEEIDYMFIKKAYFVSSLGYISSVGKIEPKELEWIKNELTQTIPDYKQNIYLNNKKSSKICCYMLENHSRLLSAAIPTILKITGKML